MKLNPTKLIPNKTYLGKVINALGVQAARNFKAKRGLVGISQLIADLKAFRSKTELSQLKDSINYLIKNKLVRLVLPEPLKKSMAAVGLGSTNLCGCGCNPCCDPCCRPRLSVGVVYGNDGLPINQLGCGGGACGCGPCGGCGSCGDCCGSCCGGSCRPRLSIGVVYPSETEGVNQFKAMGGKFGVNQFKQGVNKGFGLNQMKQAVANSGFGLNQFAKGVSNGLGMNQMCCSSSCGSCRPRLSVGVVYPNSAEGYKL